MKNLLILFVFIIPAAFMGCGTTAKEIQTRRRAKRPMSSRKLRMGVQFLKFYPTNNQGEYKDAYRMVLHPRITGISP